MKRRLGLFALVLVLGLVAAGCGGGEEEPSADDPTGADTGSTEADTGGSATGEGGEFKIAYQGPLTGDNAALGINMVCGVQLAIDELNESGDLGDITLTIEELDSQGDPAQAPALANQAAGDDAVLAVVGPAFSGETAASGPIYEEAGLPFVSPSATNPDLSEEGWEYFFRTVATDAAQGPVAATYIADNLGAMQVAVIDDSSEYGLGLADIVESSLEELGAEIVAREGIEAGGSDFSSVVGTVVQSGAEAVFYGGYFSDAGLLRRQLVENGGQDITFVSDDGTFDGGFIEIAGDAAAEGSFVTFPGADPLSVEQSFLDSYGEIEGCEEPGAFSIESYQNTLLVGQAIAEVGPDREAIKDFIAEFDGEIFGKQISFDGNDIAAQSFFIYEVQDGAFAQVEAVEAEGGASAGGGSSESEEESESEEASESESEEESESEATESSS